MPMKARAAKFGVALAASILSSATLIAAPGNTDQADDKCLSSPGDKTPSGGHWRYRVERGTGRQCWYLKGDSDRAARRAPEETSAAADEPAPAPPRRKATATRALSDAHAEFSRTTIEPDTGPAPIARAAAPATGMTLADSNQTSPKDANMMAPSAAVRWPDPMSTANTGVKAPAAPPDQ